VNNVGEGTASAQASAKTTGTAPLPTESIYWTFNNVTTNSGTLAVTPTSNLVTFVTTNPVPKYGSHSLKFDNSGVFRAQANTDVELIAPNFSTGFSFSLWINIRDNSNLAEDRLIMQLRSISGWVWFYLRNKRICCSVYRNGPGYFQKTFPDFVMAENVWYHLALTFTSTNNLTFYKDGIADSGDTTTSPSIGSEYSTTMLGLGGAILASGLTVNVATRFDGNIDEFRYYINRVLTSTEINNLKNTNAP
jgi:hypothetical protein